MYICTLCYILICKVLIYPPIYSLLILFHHPSFPILAQLAYVPRKLLQEAKY